MFGYVTIDKPEMKIRDYYQYKGYYCGLCHQLKEMHGMRGQMALTYDMTFVVILLTSLYEEETAMQTRRCAVHPVRKIPVLKNPVTVYGADMNLLLAYYHFVDDWQDEKSLPGLAGLRLLHKEAQEVVKKYPRQAAAFRRQLKALRKLERQQVQNVDMAAGCFGHMMEELFVFRQDEWEEKLRRLGFYLGKFIYLLDAFEDLPEDKKKGQYNPLKKLFDQNQPEEFVNICRQMLEMMISECSSAFEQLPCLQEAEILRNILYSGVWVKYRKLIKKDENTKGGIYDNQSI